MAGRSPCHDLNTMGTNEDMDLDVIFEEVKPCYHCDQDLAVIYRLGKGCEPSAHDWVGLYRADWAHPHDYLTYQWTPRLGRGAQLPCLQSVTFPSSQLQIPDALDQQQQQFQLLYVTRKQQVLGVSPRFLFAPTAALCRRCVAASPLLELNSYELVDLSASSSSSTASSSSSRTSYISDDIVVLNSSSKCHKDSSSDLEIVEAEKDEAFEEVSEPHDLAPVHCLPTPEQTTAIKSTLKRKPHKKAWQHKLKTRKCLKKSNPKGISSIKKTPGKKEAAKNIAGGAEPAIDLVSNANECEDGQTVIVGLDDISFDMLPSQPVKVFDCSRHQLPVMTVDGPAFHAAASPTSPRRLAGWTGRCQGCRLRRAELHSVRGKHNQLRDSLKQAQAELTEQTELINNKDVVLDALGVHVKEVVDDRERLHAANEKLYRDLQAATAHTDWAVTKTSAQTGKGAASLPAPARGGEGAAARERRLRARVRTAEDAAAELRGELDSVQLVLDMQTAETCAINANNRELQQTLSEERDHRVGLERHLDDVMYTLSTRGIAGLNDVNGNHLSMGHEEGQVVQLDDWQLAASKKQQRQQVVADMQEGTIAALRQTCTDLQNDVNTANDKLLATTTELEMDRRELSATRHALSAARSLAPADPSLPSLLIAENRRRVAEADQLRQQTRHLVDKIRKLEAHDTHQETAPTRPQHTDKTCQAVVSMAATEMQTTQSVRTIATQSTTTTTASSAGHPPATQSTETSDPKQKQTSASVSFSISQPTQPGCHSDTTSPQQKAFPLQPLGSMHMSPSPTWSTQRGHGWRVASRCMGPNTERKVKPHKAHTNAMRHQIMEDMSEWVEHDVMGYDPAMSICSDITSVTAEDNDFLDSEIIFRENEATDDISSNSGVSDFTNNALTNPARKYVALKKSSSEEKADTNNNEIVEDLRKITLGLSQQNLIEDCSEMNNLADHLRKIKLGLPEHDFQPQNHACRLVEDLRRIPLGLSNEDLMQRPSGHIEEYLRRMNLRLTDENLCDSQKTGLVEELRRITLGLSEHDLRQQSYSQLDEELSAIPSGLSKKNCSYANESRMELRNITSWLSQGLCCSSDRDFVEFPEDISIRMPRDIVPVTKQPERLSDSYLMGELNKITRGLDECHKEISSLKQDRTLVDELMNITLGLSEQDIRESPTAHLTPIQTRRTTKTTSRDSMGLHVASNSSLVDDLHKLTERMSTENLPGSDTNLVKELRKITLGLSKESLKARCCRANPYCLCHKESSTHLTDSPSACLRPLDLSLQTSRGECATDVDSKHPRSVAPIDLSWAEQVDKESKLIEKDAAVFFYPKSGRDEYNSMLNSSKRREGKSGRGVQRGNNYRKNQRGTYRPLGSGTEPMPFAETLPVTTADSITNTVSVFSTADQPDPTPSPTDPHGAAPAGARQPRRFVVHRRRGRGRGSRAYTPRVYGNKTRARR